MKPIQDFQSYRRFLQATYENIKKSQPKLSIESYSKKLGLSPSHFKMILSGSRNLTTHLALQIARALRMSIQETEYFEALVLYEHSKSPWEKAFYSRRFSRIKKTMKTDNVRISSKAFVSDLLVPALMVYLSDMMKPGISTNDIDVAKLAKLFHSSPEKIKDTLNRLEESGLIQTHDRENLHFVFDKLTNVLAQKTYLKNLMNEAQSRLDLEYENSESIFTAFTFSTSNEKLQSLRADLNELMERYMSQIDATAPSARIAQACVQVFPVSEANN